MDDGKWIMMVKPVGLFFQVGLGGGRKNISGLVGLAFGLINILERTHKEDVKDEGRIDSGDDVIFKQNIGAAPIHSWDPRNGTVRVS